MYHVKHRRPKRFDYDLIVIGSGSGGGVAAHAAAKAGKKVAIIEAEKMGGECPNFGCVPTKSLLHAAEAYQTMLDGERFGVSAKNIEVDYRAVKAWKDAVVKHTGTDEGEDFFHAEGIDTIHGYAHFVDPWTVTVNRQRLRGKNFLIATGTRSVIPPIPGLKESGAMTYREAINLTSLPKSIFVLGAGAIGCEFTHLFATFGVDTHIADMSPRLIAVEDLEIGELTQALFERRGIHVHTNSKVTKIVNEDGKHTVCYEQDGQIHQITVEAILVASGKAPNTDLGLENAGVAYNRGGVKVDAHMRTSAKHIYAAGDVVGPYRFTHTAAYQSRIAVHNMFHREKKHRAHYNAVPRCIFIEPEMACVGLSEDQLKAKGIKYQTAASPVGIIGRANTSAVNTGFVKVITDMEGYLLGASIASPRAGEMIQELALAIRHNMTAKNVAETIHAFPTWTEAVRNACQKITAR